MSNVLKCSVFLTVLAMLTLSGCANYELNTKRGNIPGQYIRTEMQEADRAIDAARKAGKNRICPAEFKAAEDARDNAYDVFRSAVPKRVPPWQRRQRQKPMHSAT